MIIPLLQFPHIITLLLLYRHMTILHPLFHRTTIPPQIILPQTTTHHLYIHHQHTLHQPTQQEISMLHQPIVGTTILTIPILPIPTQLRVQHDVLMEHFQLMGHAIM